MKLLLLSNATNYGQQYLEHAMPWIKEHFSGLKKILFIPYAKKNHESYTNKMIDALKELNIEIISAHTRKNPVELLDQVDGIIIGGGNTFRLLNELYKNKLIEPLANKIKNGTPYMGASAGINVVCPTIKTTNDMPIVYPPSFNALGLVNFQINPHYLDPQPDSKHQGETREVRLAEFHEENKIPVIGLREGSALKIEGENITLLGPYSARIFHKDKEVFEVQPGVIYLKANTITNNKYLNFFASDKEIITVTTSNFSNGLG
ncbi:MAG: dipeptidase PepE [Tatlockia sp.]|nr:dipeptidase PepE [Tatlockia sp.]